MGSSAECSYDAEFFATTMMHLPSIVGCYRNEIQMRSTLYIDRELTVALQEHGILEGFYGCFTVLRLSVC